MKIIFLCISFLITIPLFPQDNIEIVDRPSFLYVYMEFQESYEKVFEKIGTFQNECQKQDLQSVQSGNLFILFISDEGPVWRLGYPISEGIPTQSPLLIMQMDSMKVAKNKQVLKVLYDTRTAINRTIYKIEEMGLHRHNHVMLGWLSQSLPKPGGENHTEIMIPVSESDVPENIIETIYRFTVSTAAFLYVFFIVFLLTQKKGTKTVNLLLVCLLFSIFMGKLFDWNVGYYKYSVFTAFPHLFYIGHPFVFCIAPLLFLYTRSLLRQDFCLKKRHCIHFIPFVLIVTVTFLKYHRFDAPAKREIYQAGALFPAWAESFGFIFLNLQTIGYVVAALLVLYWYRSDLKNKLSSVEKLALPWLDFVLYGFLVAHFSGSLKHLLYRYMGIYSEFLAVVLHASYFLFPVIIIFHGLRHPEIFSGFEKNGNHKKWSLPKSYADHYAEKLGRFMHTDKPYLTPGITIDILAKKIGISPRNLSSILNTHFNRNFFDFINQYRVDEAKKVLSESSDRQNIMQVLYDVGFNSKSAFYKAFKKYTGISPSEFQST